MFETSFLLACWAVLTNIFLPLIPGILLMRILFGTRRQGVLLWIIGRFVGVGAVANRVFDLNFIRHTVGVRPYVILVVLGFLGRARRMRILNESPQEFLKTLWVESLTPMIHAITQQSTTAKVFTIGILAYGLIFLVNSFVFEINLPTYGDDSFGNRNKPTVNILQDGGIKMMGPQDQILGRGRLGYPIHIPVYKSEISSFLWGFRDIYNNLFEYLALALGLSFVMVITRDRTKNPLLTVLPMGLICSLPLVFFHSVEGYMELPSARYSVLSIRFLYEFLRTKDPRTVVLAVFLISTLVNIKNDGFVIYTGGIVVAYLGLTLLLGQLRDSRQALTKTHRRQVAITLVTCFLPYIVIKLALGLGFNQAAGDSTAAAATGIHREIFSVIPHTFSAMDNYGLIGITAVVYIYALIRLLKKKKYPELGYILPGFMIGILFLAAFLFTADYAFVMDQTTVNRVFSMTFLIIISFMGILLDEAQIPLE